MCKMLVCTGWGMRAVCVCKLHVCRQVAACVHVCVCRGGGGSLYRYVCVCLPWKML